MKGKKKKNNMIKTIGILKIIFIIGLYRVLNKVYFGS